VILSIVGDYRSILVNSEDKINLNIQYDPKSIVINADKDRIAQVISNLLSNAVKFTTKEKGTINVMAEKKVSEAIVTIKRYWTGNRS
jgi:signal transduction histidine kinase